MDERQQRGHGDGGGGGNGGSSRWNPTKEQISLLEGLYSRGLRTPTAEQIQHITRTLTKYGHIQGKNVFYWFQNHKARQRQKQKHHHQPINFAYFNHHYPPPFSFFPPHPTTAVVCSPNEHLGFYRQFPNVQPPEALNETTTQWYNQSMHEGPTSQNEEETFQYFNFPAEDRIIHPQQTLDLFPIHPTGILQARNIEIHQEEEDKGPNAVAVPNTQTSSDKYCGTDDHDDHHHDHCAFFDFLCRD